MEQARVVTEGKDVTLVAYGPLVKTARDAALAAADEGISVEVIDLRSLAPVDFATVEASVRKTGRLVITHEAGPVRRARRRGGRQHHRTLLLLPGGRSRPGHRVSTSRTPTPSSKCTICRAWTGSSTAWTVPWAGPTP